MKTTLCRLMCTAFLLLLAISVPAGAQTKFPNHLIRLLVPYAPGGGQDTVARALGSRLSEIIGEQVIVENRPGGAGIIAGEALLNSTPDGHTIYLVSTSFVVAPSLKKKLPFDPLKDFAPITRVAASPGALVVHSSLPVKNVKDLIALAKARPGQLNFGSAGVGAQSHLSGELLKSLAGIDIVHVPYKGSALATVALLSGEVEMSFANPTSMMELAKEGKLKILAVTTAERSPLFPDIPTIAESGVPGFENFSWNGIVTSAAVPKAVITQLHGAVTKILKKSDFKEVLAKAGGNVPFVDDTPEKFAAFLKSQIARWKRILRQVGIKPQ